MASVLQFIACCVFIFCLNFKICYGINGDNRFIEFIQVAGKCGSGHITNVKTVMKKAQCEPRYTIVDIMNYFPSNMTVYPNKIQIKKCSGGCSKFQSCLPMPMSVKEIDVHVWIQEGFKKSCGIVRIEEHTKCTCDCSVMRSDCNELQTYSSDSCSCKCNDEKRKKQECEVQDKMTWNSKTCNCECREKYRKCEYGMWVPDICSCMQVTPMVDYIEQ